MPHQGLSRDSFGGVWRRERKEGKEENRFLIILFIKKKERKRGPAPTN
jgi:hypothetical protein